MTIFQPDFEKMLRTALLIRRVEERIIEIYPTDKIQSPVHLSIGQEPVAVGVCAALAPQDKFFLNYRSHAFYIAKGGNLSAMVAELYGKATGCCGGKGGSMHLADPEAGLMGASAVVAAAVPQAIGMAMALRHQNKGTISVVAFGDGATEEGVYHESLNFAALHKIPVLFICENNGLAVHSHLKDRHAYELSDQAKLYGMNPVIIENGMDMDLIAKTTKALADQVRSGEGPVWLEIRTCRYREHVGPGEDWHAGYRNPADLAPWQARDPLLTNPEIVAKLEREVMAEVDAAFAFAETSPFPGAEALLSDV